MKVLRLIFFFQLAPLLLFAQLQSPEQFLGYPIGKKYTPHNRIIDYYKHVAAAVPSMVKLQQYGETYEGRPMYVAFVGSAENIARLDDIRENNRYYAGLVDRSGGRTDNPVILWFSYNVHGNEASSSETALQTLYTLVNPAHAPSKQWLRNALVVIDPCLNPDGRDRYVNWFNSVVGNVPNPSLHAREHAEPWPGGRTNHYNFDLNRDWAWQTQQETRQRMELYNNWMPQVHVDFHEQYINNPYYFAPAAQPYHEVITPWQRSFQETIGRNHARYFDEKGWLYFTREQFDLLYPSYGDTYPTFTGAIGMTYEQAGHSLAGLSVLTASGDTLTLADRVEHHFTTSMSTIEVSAQHADKLIAEFRQFYTKANSGAGPYKSYIIKNRDADEQRIKSLLQLLDRNHIRYGTARASANRGYNYHTGKEENFSVSVSDVVIPSAQPRGALVQVLFEPNTTVNDSATYDITAWSLPYAYGLQTFATKSAVALSTLQSPFTKKAVADASDPYGYIIRWNGVASVKLISQLMAKGVRLRFSQKPFEARGETFERGSVIILRTGNQYVPALWSQVRALAAEHDVSLVPVQSGFVDRGADFGSGNVSFLKAPKVAVFTGEGINANAAGEVWHFFEQEIRYPVTMINVNRYSTSLLHDYDVVIMPGGTYRFLNDKVSADAFHAWVQSGGRVIAMENAVAQLAKWEWSIKGKKTEEGESKNTYEVLRRYEDRERDFIPNTTPGSIFRVDLDNTHPLGFGFPGYYYTLKQDDQIYEFIKEDGWNVGVLKNNNQVAGFVGSKLQKRLQDGLLFGVQESGSGTITYLTDNPLFRSFWENGKLLFSNAVFLVGQ